MARARRRREAGLGRAAAASSEPVLTEFSYGQGFRLRRSEQAVTNAHTEIFVSGSASQIRHNNFKCSFFNTKFSLYIYNF